MHVTGTMYTLYKYGNKQKHVFLSECNIYNRMSKPFENTIFSILRLYVARVSTPLTQKTCFTRKNKITLGIIL